MCDDVWCDVEPTMHVLFVCMFAWMLCWMYTWMSMLGGLPRCVQVGDAGDAPACANMTTHGSHEHHIRWYRHLYMSTPHPCDVRVASMLVCLQRMYPSVCMETEHTQNSSASNTNTKLDTRVHRSIASNTPRVSKMQGSWTFMDLA